MLFQRPFYRGDTFIQDLTFRQADKVTPLSLEGCALWVTLKLNYEESDEAAGLQANITDHLDAENGETRIILDAEDTAKLTPGKYMYDVQLVNAEGVVSTLEVGKVKVLADITRTIDHV